MVRHQGPVLVDTNVILECWRVNAWHALSGGYGVETVEDWKLLRSLGCDIAQGYLIAKPMPADALLAWTGANRARLHTLAHSYASTEARRASSTKARR